MGLVDDLLEWSISPNDLSDVTICLDWVDAFAFNPLSIIPEIDPSYKEAKKLKEESTKDKKLGDCMNLFV